MAADIELGCRTSQPHHGGGNRIIPRPRRIRGCHGLMKEGIGASIWLTLPEAGPRRDLHFSPDQPLRVDIVVSIGIAPGINAVIDGIVQRHFKYATKHNVPLEVFGLQDGFLGFSHPESLVTIVDKSMQGSNVVTSEPSGIALSFAMIILGELQFHL